MDFGFGSLVDKFDERVGRLPTTILLHAALLAAYLIIGKLVFDVLVSPLFSVFKADDKAVVGTLKSLLMVGLYVFVAASVFAIALSQILRRRVEAILEKANKRVAETLHFEEELKAALAMIATDLEDAEEKDGKIDAETLRKSLSNVRAACQLLIDRKVD